MKYRALDNGDYTMGKPFLNDKEAVGQAIQTRLKFLYGEWWENIEDGLPLFEKILGVYADKNNRQMIDMIISERIQKTRGVNNLISYESEFENRVYKVNCKVKTIFGNIDITIYENNQNLEVRY